MKLVLVLFGLAYLISPVDVIPDLLIPWLGWIDDGVILWAIYHLIRYGDLPWVMFKKKAGSRFFGRSPRHAQSKVHRPGSPSHNRSSAWRENRHRGKQASHTGGDTACGPDPQGHRPNKHRQADKSPSEVLGVPPNASQQEIRKAYKEKIKQYHPDKLSHLGQAFTDLANEKFLEIQEAYDKLKKAD